MTPADDWTGDAPAGEGAPRIVTLVGIGGRQPVLAHILASSGVVVEEVADVPAILTLLRERPDPDLIVLEWRLSDAPTIEGLQGVLGSVREPSMLLVVAPGQSDVAARKDPLPGGEFFPAREGESRAPAPSSGSVVASGGREPGEGTSPLQRDRGEVCAGALRLDSCRAYWNGQRVALSLTEFRIVSRLAGSPGVDYSHRDIYDIMKGEGVVSGRGEGGYRGNVRAAIKRIRRKFVSIDPGFSAICNYHGFGYHWNEEAATDAREAAGEVGMR